MTDDRTGADRRPPAFPRVDGRSADGEATTVDTGSVFLPKADDENPVLVQAFASPDGKADAIVGPVGGSPNGWRWVAALVATVVVVAVIVGVFLLAGPRIGAPSFVAHYVPADAAAYAEVRLDLPGDQHDRLASFMSHFPGFADPAAFQQKIDEALQQALQSSDAGFDWKNDVEPWFGGQIGISTQTVTSTVGTPPSMVIVLTVKDRAKLDAFVSARQASIDARDQIYKGQTIWMMTSTAVGGKAVSFTVTDDVLLVGTRVEDVEKALDVKAGDVPSLADDAFVTQQFGTFHADRLAAFYYDFAPSMASLPSQMVSIPAGCLNNITDLGDLKYVGELRAETDHLALTSRMQYPTGGAVPPVPANSRSTLVEAAPADAVAYVEMHQLGGTVGWLIGQGMNCLDTTGTAFNTGQIQQLLGVAPQDFFDFLIDGAVIVTGQAGTYGGGLIATVDDENVARQRVERLMSTVRTLAALGSGLTIEEQQHGDATITVIRTSALGGAAPFQSISLAVNGGRLYLGLDDFVARALDRTATDSLASAPGFQAALNDGGVDNVAITYVDVAAIRDSLETVMQVADRAHYDAEVKPFLAPLDHLVVVSRNDNGILVSNTFFYVE